MKKKLTFLCLLILTVCTPFYASADEYECDPESEEALYDPNCGVDLDDPVPLDGGVHLLVGTAVAYAYRKLRQKKVDQLS